MLNPQAVSFYRTLLTGLRSRGIRPFVTLYHWDLPQRLEEEGGWTSRDTAHRFAEYCGLVIDEVGDLADHWITLNEPWCSAFLGYGFGAHAPGRTDLRAATAAAHHLNLAHGLAVREIRSRDSALRVGITNIVTDIVTDSTDPEDLSAAERLDATSNRVFLDPIFHGVYSSAVVGCLEPYGLADVVQPGDLEVISSALDFAGINHYQRVVARFDPAEPFQVAQSPAEPATTAFGWSVVPESMTNVLYRVSAEFTTLPIYVTESGASYHDCVDPNGHVMDTERVEYLKEYISAVGAAQARGAKVAGYFAWSLLDNFEWGEGYSQRFGLVEVVDFATQRRTPKLSAHWYAQHVAAQEAQDVPAQHPHDAARIADPA